MSDNSSIGLWQQKFPDLVNNYFHWSFSISDDKWFRHFSHIAPPGNVLIISGLQQVQFGSYNPGRIHSRRSCEKMVTLVALRPSCHTHTNMMHSGEPGGTTDVRWNRCRAMIGVLCIRYVTKEKGEGKAWYEVQLHMAICYEWKALRWKEHILPHLKEVVTGSLLQHRPATGPQHHLPPSLTSCSATGQKLLQVKHENKGGRAEKKLGVCWSENSRGHELPAVVFNAALHGAKSDKRFISDLITSTRCMCKHWPYSVYHNKTYF